MGEPNWEQQARLSMDNEFRLSKEIAALKAENANLEHLVAQMRGQMRSPDDIKEIAALKVDRDAQFRLVQMGLEQECLLIDENARYRAALEQIAGSIKWGQDTAIKREITMLQQIAKDALEGKEV